MSMSVCMRMRTRRVHVRELVRARVRVKMCVDAQCCEGACVYLRPFVCAGVRVTLCPCCCYAVYL